MLNWLKGHKYSKYREILLNAFPRTLKKDVESVLHILPFEVNDVKLCDGKIHKVDNLIHPDNQVVKINGELLTIPYRFYFNEPETEKEKTLNDQQKTILNCIFLRHHNGYIRQNRLERIENSEYWVTPFTFQLLGEYIFEILEVLDEQLDDQKLEHYKRFVNENPKYYQQTESRMISYWNEYYRRKFPKLKNYVGRIIFDHIKTKKIGKRQDEIVEVGIDKDERLFIRTKNERFNLIYRTATEIHWDNNGFFLYSPKPSEWGYYDWFRHIIDVANKECNSKLMLTHRTIWTNIDNNLKKQIIENRKATA
ncbi:hypothetical protein [Sphingobacterium sp.]|uniref:hypothetical protein n=1 Tax=Sphingobacterium sp. TaxID=341027 RepID=UPI0028AF7758|nr:hypothetical protein [Sphingobacterium sp.]